MSDQLRGGVVLESLNLSTLETRCYEALVTAGDGTAEDVQRITGAEQASVTGALAVLVDRGLVTPSADTADRYVPAPPEVAVEVLILQQREAQERARIYAAGLMGRYRDGSGPGRVTEHVDLVHGREAVAQRFQQLQRSAREEIIVFVKAPFLTPADEQATTESELLRGGLRVRGIYERRALESPDDEAQVARLLREGEEARVVPEVPFKLAIADRSLAMVPFNPEVTSGESAFLVHPSGLLTALAALADALWDSGTPLAHVVDNQLAGEPTGRDREILQLLQAGLTDAAIARRLGNSERTVGRRVRQLMDETGAQTRFQLGWRAAERGWLDGPEPAVG